MKWQTIESRVNGIKKAALIYEEAFNDIIGQTIQEDNYKMVSTM